MRYVLSTEIIEKYPLIGLYRFEKDLLSFFAESVLDSPKEYSFDGSRIRVAQNIMDRWTDYASEILRSPFEVEQFRENSHIESKEELQENEIEILFGAIIFETKEGIRKYFVPGKEEVKNIERLGIVMQKPSPTPIPLDRASFLLHLAFAHAVRNLGEEEGRHFLIEAGATEEEVLELERIWEFKKRKKS